MPDLPVIVIKIGSNSLVDGRGRLDAPYLRQVAKELSWLRSQGRQPVLVTSGAVASGVGILGLAERPPGLPERQALAAIGQVSLARAWEEALAQEGLVAAQILLTHDDFAVRSRYLNLCDTLRALFAFGAIPVINENDTVAVQELTVGDNDRLSALVATQLGAERLLLLTDIDGVYDADPRSTPTAKRLREIPVVTAAVLAAAGGAGAKGRGGMRSKVEAARLASGAGVVTHIVPARVPHVIRTACGDGDIGTRIPARGERADSRRRWLAVARHVKGTLTIDDGAATALVRRGRSLLPAGITACEGRFERGDTVAIRTTGGEEIARGLAALDSHELTEILGLKLDAAAKRLGHPLPKAAVHRDDLLLLV